MTSHADGRTGGSDTAGWTAVVIDAAEPFDEELTARLAAGCLGADERRRADGGISFRIYLELAAALDARLGDVERALLDAGLPRSSWSIRAEHVADGRWVERWVAGLRPFALGRRFVVLPGGATDVEADPARSTIRLVPGRAFGTGEHPTTRLCAVALERFVEPGQRWLDVGCGTGILSLIASRCGAAEVTALDVDPEAIAVTGEVLAANDEVGTVRAVVGGIDDVEGAWDGIVVNIEGDFVEARADALAARLLPGGRLLVSGLLAAQRFAAARRLQTAGLEIDGAAQDDGWALVVARRAEGG